MDGGALTGEGLHSTNAVDAQRRSRGDGGPTEPYTSVLLDDDSAGSGDGGREVATAAAGDKYTGNLGQVPNVKVDATSGAAYTASTAATVPDWAGETTATSSISGVTAPAPDEPESHASHDLTALRKPSQAVAAASAASPAHQGYVQPSSYLRRSRAASRTMPSAKEESPVERDQKVALRSIRAFLKLRTGYDVLPMSFRLICFDTSLLVKKSLNILVQNGIVSAPLWDSKTSTFAGMLTTSDYINLIQYYWQNPDAVARIDQFRLDSLRDIEKAIGVATIETVSVHPMNTLYEASRRLIDARARRIPMVDIDDDTNRAMNVSVLTQYRLLKFVAINVSETQLLKIPLKYLPNVGTYRNISTADMDTPVIRVIHMMVSKQISSVPILNSDGVVVNVFEAVDVITLIKGGSYECLTMPVGEALCQRAPDFPGIFTCSLDDRLDSILDTIRRSRVHRFVVIDDSNRLKGILALSDILKYILLEGESEDQT